MSGGRVLKEQPRFWEQNLPVFLVFTKTQLVECPNVRALQAPGKIRTTLYTQYIEDRASVEEILQKNPPAMMIPYADIMRLVFSRKTSWGTAELNIELTTGERRKYMILPGSSWSVFGPEAEKWPNAPMSRLASVLEGKMELADQPQWKPGPITEEDKKYMKQCHSCQAWIPVAAESCDKCGAKQKK
jgi:ribosomal protein L40E